MIVKSIVLAMSLLFLSGSAIAEKKAPAEETATLVVKKMTWGGCAGKVKRALSKVKGIKKVSTKVSKRLVVITIKDKDEFDLKKAIAAIKKGTGWKATEKKDSEEDTKSK